MYVQELTDLDYQILKYFRDNSPSTIEDAQKHLPDIESIEYRIRTLATPEYTTNLYINHAIENTRLLNEDYEKHTRNGFSSSTYLGTFNISILGRKVLQDHEVAEKKRKKDIWLVNAKIPILVSFITTVLLNWLLPLLPEMLKWFANSL